MLHNIHFTRFILVGSMTLVCFFSFFFLILYLVTNVARVSGWSILDCPIGFLWCLFIRKMLNSYPSRIFLFLLMIFFRELFNACGCASFRYWQRSKRNCKYRWPCVRNRQRITPFKLIHETLSRQTFKVSHQQNSTGC